MNIREGAEIIRFTRIDIPEYPYETLREALVNAVAHRDYSREGETIRIFFYSDRVEVHSPGLLPPGVTVEDLAAMRAPSRPRNPMLTQFLREIPGYMERIGSGARLMIQEMRQLGLADPEFVEQHEFVVTFRNGQLPTTADAMPYRMQAGPLAIKPVTLDMLLGMYRNQGQFPRTQADLYAAGCRLLCAEENPYRRAVRRVGKLSPDQRMLVAGRIAAVTVFANKFAVWMGIDRGDGRSAPSDNLCCRHQLGCSVAGDTTRCRIRSRSGDGICPCW